MKGIGIKKRLEIFNRQGGKCALCGCDISIEYTGCRDTQYIQIDHIRPKSLGGTNKLDNLRGLCKHCNSSRNNISCERLINLILKEIGEASLDNRIDSLIDDISNNLINTSDIESIRKAVIQTYNHNIELLTLLDTKIKERCKNGK